MTELDHRWSTASGCPKAHDLWPPIVGRPALISACAYVDSQDMDEITILQAEVLKTLASPRRLEILHVLARGPIEVGHLAEAIGATQPNVSQHLAMLRAAGIVEAERDGREVRYRLADPDVMVACGVMRGVLERRLRRLADLSTTPDIPTESAATGQPATTTA
jgi:DNA-binding transcriptional ArsR family regulator